MICRELPSQNSLLTRSTPSYRGAEIDPGFQTLVISELLIPYLLYSSSRSRFLSEVGKTLAIKETNQRDAGKGFALVPHIALRLTPAGALGSPIRSAPPCTTFRDVGLVDYQKDGGDLP